MINLCNGYQTCFQPQCCFTSNHPSLLTILLNPFHDSWLMQFLSVSIHFRAVLNTFLQQCSSWLNDLRCAKLAEYNLSCEISHSDYGEVSKQMAVWPTILYSFKWFNISLCYLFHIQLFLEQTQPLSCISLVWGGLVIVFPEMPHMRYIVLPNGEGCHSVFLMKSMLMANIVATVCSRCWYYWTSKWLTDYH